VAVRGSSGPGGAAPIQKSFFYPRKLWTTLWKSGG